MSARQAITLVAWREIHERLRSRAFLASTLLMLALVGASSALSLVLSTETTYKVAVVAPVPKGLDAALQRAAKPFEAKVKLQTVTSAAAGREQVNAKQVDVLLLLAKSQLVFRWTSTPRLPRQRTRPCGRCDTTCRPHPS
jgi:ABC-2 type transport system permease protein